MTTTQFETLKSQLTFEQNEMEGTVSVYDNGNCVGVYSFDTMKLDVFCGFEIDGECMDLTDQEVAHIECTIEEQFKPYEPTQEITEEHFRTYIH